MMDRNRAVSCLTVFSPGARWVRRIGLVSFLAFQLWGCGGKNSSPERANFSDYFPMTKGTYRTYRVTAPSPLAVAPATEVTQTVTQVLTSGASYNGLASVRTCRSPLSWSDDVASGNRIIRAATLDDYFPLLQPEPVPNPFVNPGTPGPQPFGPFLLGIDNWEAGQTLSSTVPFSLRSNLPPLEIPLTLTFRDLETITIAGAVFRDSMKVDLSVIVNDPAFAFSFARTDWFARGLGRVKSILYNGPVLPGEPAQQVAETWELTDHGTLSSLSPSPQLLNISPAEGPFEGGTEFTLTGKFFSDGAQVTVGTRLATSVTVVSPTEMKAVTPTGPIGPADVTVVNEDCQVSLLEDEFTFQ
jgi:hypothetical protein